MGSPLKKIQDQPNFKRKNLVLKLPPTQGFSRGLSAFLERSGSGREEADKIPKPTTQSIPQIIPEREFKVLIINSGQEMAKEITLQLTLSIPGCSIMYAPSLELAKLILKRRKLDLIISSPVLPDGGITKLRETLEDISSPPDLMVVGNLASAQADLLGDSSYRFKSMKHLATESLSSLLSKDKPLANSDSGNIGTTIKDLGADIRNDLNNPLQEIVAMVYVARSGVLGEDTSNQALAAIEKAAKNMSYVVNALEDKIRTAIVSDAP